VPGCTQFDQIEQIEHANDANHVKPQRAPWTGTWRTAPSWPGRRN